MPKTSSEFIHQGVNSFIKDLQERLDKIRHLEQEILSTLAQYRSNRFKKCREDHQNHKGGNSQKKPA